VSSANNAVWKAEAWGRSFIWCKT